MITIEGNSSSAVNGDGKLLTFMCSEIVFAFYIQDVKDIIEIPEITPLPLVSDYVAGVINHRGKVLPVVDFSLRMGFEQPVYNNRSCIVVIDCDDSDFGAIVEKVCDTEVFSEDEFVPSPIQKSFVSGYINLDDQKITVIDAMRFSRIKE